MITKKNPMAYKPMAGYIFIEVKSEEKTSGGIYLAENQDSSRYGEIISIGSPITKEQDIECSQFQIGDIVIYKNWGNTDIKFSGKIYKFIQLSDVIGKTILEDENV
jgi:co-chaperonin GroES (HSP10)